MRSENFSLHFVSGMGWVHLTSCPLGMEFSPGQRLAFLYEQGLYRSLLSCCVFGLKGCTLKQEVLKCGHNLMYFRYIVTLWLGIHRSITLDTVLNCVGGVLSMKNVSYKVQLNKLLNLNESSQWSILLFVHMTGGAQLPSLLPWHLQETR